MDGQLPGAGFDRRTGRILAGWPHVVQSLEVIFTTLFSERIMREWFGSMTPAMLGRNLTVDTVGRTMTAIYVAVEMYEPRFAIVRFMPLSVTRLGGLGLDIAGEYRPYGHLGDKRAEGNRRLRLEAREPLRLTDQTP